MQNSQTGSTIDPSMRGCDSIFTLISVIGEKSLSSQICLKVPKHSNISLIQFTRDINNNIIINKNKLMKKASETKEQLHIIFIYYASYADRNNYRLLKKQNYRRFLIDSQSVLNENMFVYFDIAFQKLSNSGIIFHEFLNLLPDLAELVFKKMSRSEAFKQYLQRNLNPLFQQILNESQFGSDVQLILNPANNHDFREQLSKTLPLTKAYDQYLGNQNLQGKDQVKVFEAFANFLKQFQIYPHLMSKSIAYIVFLSHMNNKDHSFSYHNYVDALIVIAEVSGRKVIPEQLSFHTRIVNLLERMEISPGFEKLSKKVLFETGVTPSLLKNFIQIPIDQLDNDIKLSQQMSHLFPSSTRHKNCRSINQSFNTLGYNSNTKDKRKSAYQSNYQTVQQKIENEQMGRDIVSMKKKFEDLCSYGEVANCRTLKSFKIKKLYQRIGLLKLLDVTWLDIQISNLLRSSESGKIQFCQFLELISITAEKLKASYDDVSDLIIKDKQEVNDDSNQLARKTLSLDENRMQKEILQCVFKPGEKIFKHYTHDKPVMGFSQYSKVMYQFEIFPSVISKNKLYKIFSYFAGLPIKQNQKQEKNLGQWLTQEKHLGIQGFILSLIDVSQQICESCLEANQKLIILLQKMNESKGCKKLCPAGQLVNEVRSKFASYYQKSFKKPPQHTQDFDQLIQMI